MTGFFDKAKHVTGVGLNQNELYNRAYAKGVFFNKYLDAADMFDKAANKFADPLMATQARANALLYRYIATGDARLLTPLLGALQNLPEIEVIRSQTETMPSEPLRAELDCRLVEDAIARAQNNIVQSRDLHKIALDKFQAVRNNPLITYQYLPAQDGHNDKTEMRHFYHKGMYHYYDAMLKKDRDPEAASTDLSNARQSFRGCNDQKWEPIVKTLLDNWRLTRTCWLCHRDMQGYELHYSMCYAEVTPYTEALLEKLKQDSNTVIRDKKQIVVCTTCGSMVTFKARAEADKVRQELNAKLEQVVRTFEQRMDNLESKIRSHHH